MRSKPDLPITDLECLASYCERLLDRLDEYDIGYKNAVFTDLGRAKKPLEYYSKEEILQRRDEGFRAARYLFARCALGLLKRVSPIKRENLRRQYNYTRLEFIDWKLKSVRVLISDQQIFYRAPESELEKSFERIADELRMQAIGGIMRSIARMKKRQAAAKRND